MKAVNLLFFPKYTRTGASSRYRSFQYLPALEAAGLKSSVSPLFDDAYLAHKYAQGHASVGNVLRAFARRIWSVLSVPRNAVIVIEYELLPWFPAVLEHWLAWRGCRMVMDYDDAIFHLYDAHPNPWVRRLIGHKIATVMRLAHTVVAGNPYLADYARRAGAQRVEVIPTVIDLVRYPMTERGSGSEPYTIGWIGSPSTAPYLCHIAPALAEVCKNRQVKLRVVGSGQIDLPGVPAEWIPWNETTEVDEIRGFDVGIMPLPDEPWTRGKCGFKLIQYMACGLPVVASPVGVNSEIVEEGVNGFFAKTAEEWTEALRILKCNAVLRQQMGEAGRRKVEQQYALQVTGPRLVALIQSIIQAEK
ncbi:MAG: glycosyltransferase family 4 protein [Magnetococcus sp. THC-1_WYH]